MDFFKGRRPKKEFQGKLESRTVIRLGKKKGEHGPLSREGQAVWTGRVGKCWVREAGTRKGGRKRKANNEKVVFDELRVNKKC